MARPWLVLLLLGAGCVEEHPNWAGDGGETMGSASTTSSASTTMSTETSGEPTTTTGGSADAESGEESDSDGTGDDQHQIFITSGKWTGTFGGLEQADVHCQDFANQASLGGTWMAVLSDSEEHARDRVELNGPVHNLMGDLVAADEDAMWNGSLDTAVIYSEWGATITTQAWTGTDAFGEYFPGQACTDWNPMADDTGAVGDPIATNIDWAQQTFADCLNDSRALYCISQ